MIRSARVAAALLFALTATSLVAQTDAQKSFDQLKSLAGSWEGKTADGRAVEILFRLTSGGSALMSEIVSENMITMIHLDGPNRLLLTHYCSSGNQPRMQASASPDGKTVTFNFVDATNLASPDAGHMQRVVISLIDPSHHTEEWTFADHGKEMREVFVLHRKTM